MQNLFTITLLSLLMGVVCFAVIKYFSEEETITKTAGVIIFIAAFSAAALSVKYSNRLIPELVFMTFLIITGGIDALTKTVVVFLTGLGAVFLAIGAFMTGLTFLEIVLGGIVGFALYGLIYLVAKAIYKKEAFGFGDVLFMGAIGLFLGPWNTLLAGVLTFYVALVLILVQKVIGKVLNRTSEVAFAPYMAIAAGVVSLFSRSIVELYIKLFMV
ncbi:MAG: A24 family peptidase [Firmicutes bacterium]|nr:A24 family peptidase [Bacillota bacterium]